MILDKGQFDQLNTAIAKRNSGRGLKNSELSLLHKFDRATSHGESITVAQFKTPSNASGAKQNIAVEDVEGLNQRLKKLDSQIENIDTSSSGAVSVVGNDGLLNLVPKHSSWVTPTTYPTKIGQSNYPSYFEVNITGLTFQNQGSSPTKYFNLNAADLTKDMSIKEVDVCVAGVNKKMLIVASDPY